MKIIHNSKLRPIDLISIYFSLFSLILVIFFWDRIEKAFLHLFVFSAVVVFAYYIDPIYQKTQNKFIRVIRDWYSLPFILHLFEVSSDMNKIIFSDFVDPFFQNIDQIIFGYQPALIWGKVLDNYFWQELFHFAYFAYYLFILLYVYFYIKDKQSHARYMFTLLFIFIFCTITYYLLPVIGGRWWEIMENYRTLTIEYRYGIFTRIMAFIYRNTEHQGGAFPSSHVAITIGINLSAFNFNKLIGWLILPITILLTISTVHCHYHYFIDTIFGIIYGVVFYFWGNNFYNKLKVNQHNV
ncbi:MAG: phosphatase PAP2 family protein [Candidatus Cloacimonetes bacterium]|nr:phosphatase PAP2 family protein [Candidatus Cloacimonadota bacterium]